MEVQWKAISLNIRKVGIQIQYIVASVPLLMILRIQVGGYIVVGVKEVHGHAVRPVLGVNPDSIEQIERDMVGYNNLIRPYYQPRLFIEEVDGKTILVIKVTAGERRPYKVPDRITAK